MNQAQRQKVYRRRRIAVVAAALLVAGALSWIATNELGDPDGRTAGLAPAATRSPAGARHAAGAALSNAASSPAGGIYAAITTGKLNPAVAGDPPLVYVPNNLSNSVDVIDPKTFKVIRHFAVGEEPQHITPSWDLKHLYVGNTYSNSLTVIDPKTGKPTRTVHVFDPYNLYFTPDGKRAISVAERMNTLFFYNPYTWKLIGQTPIPWAGADHLDFSANGSYLLISTEYAGRVVKVDTRTMKVTGSVDVGGKPVDVKLSPDGSVFFVANQGRSGVSVIDPVRMKEIAFIHTGNGAHGFCVSRDARSLYVSNRLAGTISTISFATRKVVATWNVGGSPDMLQVSPDGTQLWVSNRFSTTVSVISTRTGKVLHVIQVGDSPHGLTYFPQPGRYSIGHNGVYR